MNAGSAFQAMPTPPRSAHPEDASASRTYGERHAAESVAPSPPRTAPASSCSSCRGDTRDPPRHRPHFRPARNRVRAPTFQPSALPGRGVAPPTGRGTAEGCARAVGLRVGVHRLPVHRHPVVRHSEGAVLQFNIAPAKATQRAAPQPRQCQVPGALSSYSLPF